MIDDPSAAARVYASLVGENKDPSLKLGWRLLWAVVGAGITFTVLSVSGYALEPWMVYGISIAAGLAVGIVGPILLDLLTLV